MGKVRKIELLSPAKDLNCGIEAVNHGADAVYIGAPKFGARAAAGNSLEDIRTLCDYAHQFGVRVYVALNTILKEDELEEAQRLVWSLYEAGADALIVQDMALMQMDLPPVPLHASTQTDNRTVEKVHFLEQAGFTQVVLARELSLDEIRRIASETDVALEVFVHGALCVSFSGQCYLSAALSGRSANRGECAQYCRLPYTMVDADGKIIADNKHLLSLKDMNRADELEALMDAGVSSFKIEGRLKDVSYVKNVTAYYRKKLDEILKRRPEYVRVSSGVSRYTFTPQVEKSFNRGFTSFYLHGRTPDVTAFDTPKSLGEFVGTVKEIRGNSFTVAGLTPLNNGDGLVFFNARGELDGFRVNWVVDNRVYPQEMPRLSCRVELYRSCGQQFGKLLSKPSAVRKIGVSMTFTDNPGGFSLEMEDGSGARITVARLFAKELAEKEQTDNIRVQLAKLGNTLFEAEKIEVNLTDNWFVPSSLLADMRREAVNLLLSDRRIRYPRELSRKPDSVAKPLFPQQQLTYLGNVANTRACSFYQEHGVKTIDPAFELKAPDHVPLMFSKHCLRYSMGWCPTYQKKKSPFREPYYLLYKEVRLRLMFDCKHCQMLVLKEVNE